MIKMKVGGQPVIFMVDSGTEHSMVTKPVAPFTECKATIVTAPAPKLPGSSADPRHAN
jgi:hypothetical protein